MEFWNLVHDQMGIHVSVLLFFILAAIMVVIALVHHKKQTTREKNNAQELERMRSHPESSRAPEEDTEKPAEPAGEAEE